MRGRGIKTPLQNIRLFQGLSESERESVKSCLREKSFKKGELIFYEGKACERIFVILSGRVKIFRTSSSGREQILETLQTGDTCACNPGSLNWSCTSSAVAVTDCDVCFLSRDDYVRMVNSNSRLAHTLNQLFAEKLKNFSALIEEIALKDVKKRLVKFLLDMSSENIQKGNVGEVLFIPFTREEIAQRLGTARESVARHLYQLKRAKLIDIKPKQIVILNREGLESLLR